MAFPASHTMRMLPRVTVRDAGQAIERVELLRIYLRFGLPFQAFSRDRMHQVSQ
jgi:hypothetical protein